jgi:hypothetical protein
MDRFDNTVDMVPFFSTILSVQEQPYTSFDGKCSHFCSITRLRAGTAIAEVGKRKVLGKKEVHHEESEKHS